MRSARGIAIPLAVLATVVISGASTMLVAPVPSGAATSASCAKYSGTVLLTYRNPDTIIVHITKGKVNAATTFTTTPSTTYTRNGLPSAFSAVSIGDTATITARAQYPGGALLACSATLTGP